MTPLLIAFFSSGSTSDVDADGTDDLPTVETDPDGTILLHLDDATRSLSRSDAAALQAAIGDALTERREFVHTACTYREDGSYVVSRRGADSSGNAKVFESVDAVRRLFDRLPERFGAESVGRTGITGSRRHMLVRHFAEHPSFPCRIVSRCPLTVEKTAGDADEVDDDSRGGDTTD